MGYEPITYCTECGEPFDLFRAPDDRVCGCCLESAILTKDNLKTRLRFVEGRDGAAATRWYRNPDGPEAADALDRAEKLIEGLEAALEHAARNMPHPDQMIDDALATYKAWKGRQ